MRPRAYRPAILACALAITIASCTSGSSPSPSAAGGGGGATVEVSLQEWAVVPASASVAAGEVTFRVTNTGPEDVHEFVVLATDLDPGALPADAAGAVTEEGEGMVVVDEIEDIPVGATQDLTVSLAAGNYVLLCNIYDQAEGEAHYQLGMRIAFTVN
jgi:uncharacterized cupredoxin-like copper-binding protein